MPIYDQSFRRYTGERQLKALWWPVAWFTFRPILRRKLVWIIIGFFILYLGALSVGFIVSAKVSEHMGERSTRDAMRSVRRQGLPIFDANIEIGTILYAIMQPLKGLLWLLILIAGAGAISSDRRYNAFPLYFSRPLKPWHYTVGKILGIAAIPLAAMLLTQWLIGMQFIAYYLPASALITELPSFFMAAIYATILCGFIATVMASISSMAKSARVAGVGFLCFFVLLEKVVPLLAFGSANNTLLSLSPLHSLDVIGRALLRPDLGNISSSVDTGTLSLTASIISVVAYLTVFLFLLRKNLRVVEVVK